MTNPFQTPRTLRGEIRLKFWQAVDTAQWHLTPPKHRYGDLWEGDKRAWEWQQKHPQHHEIRRPDEED